MTDYESALMSMVDEDPTRTAYHEAGHAVGAWLEGHRPLHAQVSKNMLMFDGEPGFGYFQSIGRASPGGANLARLILSGFAGETYLDTECERERLELFRDELDMWMAENFVDELHADGEANPVPDDDFGSFWRKGQFAFQLSLSARQLQGLPAISFEQFATDTFAFLCEEMRPYVGVLKAIAEDLKEQGVLSEERLSMWYSELDKAQEQINAEFESSRPAPATAPV